MSVNMDSCPSERPVQNTASPLTLSSMQSALFKVRFSYSVRLVDIEVRWATRYDMMLKESSGRKLRQYFAIFNCIIMAFFLSASLAAILLRNLRRVCIRYGIPTNELIDDFDDGCDLDVGWRSLNGDVFRAPMGASTLSVLCGFGAQFGFVPAISMLFAFLWFVSPHRSDDPHRLQRISKCHMFPIHIGRSPFVPFSHTTSSDAITAVHLASCVRHASVHNPQSVLSS